MAGVPWYVRMGLKLAISRAPIPRSLTRRVGIFRHGDMDDLDYALSVFLRHAGPFWGGAVRPGFVALELGPGDSLFSAAFASLAGAARTYLVDAHAEATADPRLYERTGALLQASGFPPGPFADVHSAEDLLRVAPATYLSDGARSLVTIPEASVDFAWSHAVLEHVPEAEFHATLTGLRRVLKADGVSAHRVDLRDHLGGGLNNLRFRPSVWESKLFRASGFYTNRLRLPQLLTAFADAGLVAEVTAVDRWAAPPIDRRSLARDFRTLSDDELTVSGFDVLLRRSD
jgi:SAM-dependent methyltransferase